MYRKKFLGFSRILLGLILFCIIFSGFGDSKKQSGEGKEIIVLYTNDIHCSVDNKLNFASIAAYKQELLDEGKQVVLVDAGDAVQGGPVGANSNGADIVKLMNAAGYDLAIPGNHEFDYGMENFLALTKQADFEYLSANLINLKTQEYVLAPYTIKEFDSIRIAFIGVTTPDALVSSNPESFQDDTGQPAYGLCQDDTGEELYSAVQKAVAQSEAAGADYIIALTHLGTENKQEVWFSTEVIKHTAGIDAVIDGHSHSTIECCLVPDKADDPVILTSTGSRMSAFGKLVITDKGITSTLITDYSKKDKKVQKILDETSRQDLY